MELMPTLTKRESNFPAVNAQESSFLIKIKTQSDDACGDFSFTSKNKPDEGGHVVRGS